MTLSEAEKEKSLSSFSAALHPAEGSLGSIAAVVRRGCLRQ